MIGLLVTCSLLFPSAEWKPYAQAVREYDAGKPLVIFFTASWCPACPAAKRSVEATLAKVDVAATLIDYDRPPELADGSNLVTRERVTSVPRVIVYRNGIRTVVTAASLCRHLQSFSPEK